jgi:hydroxyacylglutathione hydrolase
MPRLCPTVAIVGAGASGTITAIQLASLPSEGPLRVLLFAGSGTVGRGVAYSTPASHHLLNVPAGSMSAFPDRPHDFLQWLQSQGKAVSDGDLVPRHLFGAYLEERLADAVGAASSDIELKVLHDDVVDIVTVDGRPVLRTTAQGALPVEAVVLATGPGAVVIPRFCQPVSDSPRFVENPWKAGALEQIDPGDSVTVVGTGLTGVDVILSLAARGHQGPVYAFSRHGLLPQAHRRDPRCTPKPNIESITRRAGNVRGLLSAVRQSVKADEQSGVDWRATIDALRPHVAELWADLAEEERLRFFRHVERFWNVHRHRMAFDAAGQLDDLRVHGQLSLRAGRLERVVDHGSHLELTLKERGQTQPEGTSWVTHWLINCTGPDYRVDPLGDSLVARLVAHGTLRPGSVGLGIDTDCAGQAINGEGVPLRWLWGLGALRRGQLYETTAVPQIRGQARDVAVKVRRSLADVTAPQASWAEPRKPARLEVVTCGSPDVGDRSYLVHDGTTGVVIDPQYDIDRIESEATRRGVAITHVFETHIHNDYVSGGLTLARRSGSSYVLSADEPVAFADECLGVRGGDAIRTGALDIRVIHTPGHTPHHLSYVVELGLDDSALFSGGSMLHDATGRTDLFDAEAAELLAHAQWRSVRQLATTLHPDTLLCPTHGFGSFCAAGPSGPLDATTIGEQLTRNPALVHDEQTFVSEILKGRRPYPRYYSYMAPLNRRGYCPSFPAHLRRTDLDAIESSGDGAVIVDLRPRRLFAQSHVPGSLNVEWGDSFAAYLGWSVPWGAPLTLVAEEWDTLEMAASALTRLGIEEVAGARYEAGSATSSYQVAGFADLRAAKVAGASLQVIDARDRAEWDVGHLHGAELMPFYCVEAGVSLLSATSELWVHCARGYRAAIAASLLQRFGRRPVLVDDTFEHAMELGLTIPADLAFASSG